MAGNLLFTSSSPSRTSRKASIMISGSWLRTAPDGVLRSKLGALCPNHMDKEKYEFCWIVDFPMYEMGEESGELEFSGLGLRVGAQLVDLLPGRAEVRDHDGLHRLILKGAGVLPQPLLHAQRRG